MEYWQKKVPMGKNSKYSLNAIVLVYCVEVRNCSTIDLTCQATHTEAVFSGHINIIQFYIQ